MSAKPVYEIDGSRLSTLEEFYDEVGRVLIPDADWGHNLDAFNDILRGGFGTPDGGFVLRWRNVDLSRERLGYPETVRQLRLRLQQCHPSSIPHVKKQLAEAERGQGRTVFDWLLDIVATHAPGGQEERDGVELVLM
jgi:RNAse (barnase) inhibitor barstar